MDKETHTHVLGLGFCALEEKSLQGCLFPAPPTNFHDTKPDLRFVRHEAHDHKRQCTLATARSASHSIS
eukprot:1159547-Pelagomonas_calceolata.AAC.27